MEAMADDDEKKAHMPFPPPARHLADNWLRSGGRLDTVRKTSLR